MKKLVILLSLLLCTCIICSAQTPPPTITMGSLLQEMTDAETVTRYPSPAYTLKQASSYDRKSVSPDQPGWFANGDANQFIREEKKAAHSEFVLLDADGPGVIVRFWLTTLAKKGIMRFYFNHEPTPSLQIPAFDLMKGGFNAGQGLLIPHSSYEPEGKGGNTLYLPLPYQQHCKITWQFADSANRKTPHYYQVNYRTYAPGTKVETFTPALLQQYKTAIDKTSTLLLHPAAPEGKSVSQRVQLAPGDSIAIPMPAGAAAIRQLQLSLATNNEAGKEQVWQSTILGLQFDGQQTVLCPAGDFIGSGYGGKPITSWYRELTASGTLTSRWVMPYQHTATLTVKNNGTGTLTVQLQAIVSAYTWNNRAMYFHAAYKFEQNIKDAKWDYDLTKVAKQDTAAPIDWNFATIRGKGVYLGNTLSVNNHMKSWYGEGDAKAYVDNEAFPSEFGTGLEDYYNTSWAPVVLYQTPFANAPRADQPSSTGYNTFTRTRILDAIPFTNAFSFDMEMLSWDGGTIDAAATTYWYGFTGSTDK
ncbi:glycoside hydrolase family 172 protein [Deminuibacter soli]|uniref:DUF2961 domain-containing protein n=1 Tax=Deminuibacter soli TaxID=2291815 RepID=A0A3E1NFM1_9BACT|nr:glycoside hydrolase family 172 protein [Deminuibacter soli]RFM26770.1 DUF2961 domain-containing protein [Deminuibacter soli]